MIGLPLAVCLHKVMVDMHRHRDSLSGILVVDNVRNSLSSSRRWMGTHSGRERGRPSSFAMKLSFLDMDDVTHELGVVLERVSN